MGGGIGGGGADGSDGVDSDGSTGGGDSGICSEDGTSKRLLFSFPELALFGCSGGKMLLSNVG